jgi:hypothetical protein
MSVTASQNTRHQSQHTVVLKFVATNLNSAEENAISVTFIKFKDTIKFKEKNNQPNALNLIYLFIPYSCSYMFRQLYVIIREHLSTF